MINTHSLFYYGFTIKDSNAYIDFKEGSGAALAAEVALESYNTADFCTAIKTALDAAGSLIYTVTFNRSTRKFTISATGVFSILGFSGAHVGSTPLTLMGYSTAADLTGSMSYTSSTVAGSAYSTQFKLQDYVSTDDWQEAVDASINKTATGRVEVITFGTQKFMQANFMLATNIAQSSGGPVRNNATGESDLRSFMQYLVTKGPFEFMPDENDVSAFQTMLLESTPDSANGTGYRLKEMYDKSLPGYWQTGTLKFRLIE